MRYGRRQYPHQQHELTRPAALPETQPAPAATVASPTQHHNNNAVTSTASHASSATTPNGTLTHGPPAGCSASVQNVEYNSDDKPPWSCLCSSGGGAVRIAGYRARAAVLVAKSHGSDRHGLHHTPAESVSSPLPRPDRRRQTPRRGRWVAVAWMGGW